MNFISYHDCNEARDRRVPVAVGGRLADQDRVEDEVSEAELDTLVLLLLFFFYWLLIVLLVRGILKDNCGLLLPGLSSGILPPGRRLGLLLRVLVSVGSPDERVDHAGRVYQRREDLLVPLLRRLHEDPQWPAGRQHGEQVPEGYGAKDNPRGPVRQVLDEDEGHEGGYEDEVGLLHDEGPLPVDADHAHDAKVPQYDTQGDPVHGKIVGLQHDP